ncbi:MAG: hypothetical protein NTX71_05420 [Candidatus Aureabacteria bacterium]|nr:hypothetical protein [Candidatus Auribacterota bacterium]
MEFTFCPGRYCRLSGADARALMRSLLTASRLGGIAAQFRRWQRIAG